MANRTVFVDLGDTHGQLTSADVATNADGVAFVLQGNPAGILSAYATLAAAIADVSTLTTGQFVLIDGGDNASTGLPNADKGVYKLTGAGTLVGHYTKVMDGTDKASEISLVDAGGFFAATQLEAALAEIGTKQVFFKLGSSSLNGITLSGTTSNAANAVIDALVIDNGSGVDLVGAGTSTLPGIVLNATYPHQIPVRNNSTRNVITDGSNNEVFARLSHDGTDYIVSFFSWIAGVETAFNMPSQSLDLGFILVSQDFMKLPAHAGVTDGTFFGDEAGVIGTMDDSQIVTNAPAFTSLLNGMGTQEAVNNRVDTLGMTTAGNGASRIGIEDAGSLLTATNVEAALAELWTKAQNRIRHYADLSDAITAAGTTPFAIGEYIVIAGTTVPGDRGIHVMTGTGTLAGHYSKVLDISHTAAEVLVADAGNLFSVDTVEAALSEIMTAIGGTSSIARNYSSNTTVADNDSLVVAIGKLDAAIGAIAADKLVITGLIADGAIASTTNGPRLVGYGTNANDVSLLDSGSATIKEVVGFAYGPDVADNASVTVASTGVVSGFTGLTAGAAYYANPAAAGGITTTVPSTIGQWIVPVGVALNTTTLLVRIGEPNQVVAAEKTQQVGIHFRSTASTASTGLGETGYAVAAGDLWIDNDATVQNPTKSGTGKYTVYVCSVAWTGAGAALTSGNLASNFVAIGVQG